MRAHRILGLDERALEDLDQLVAPAAMQRVLAQLDDRPIERLRRSGGRGNGCCPWPAANRRFPPRWCQQPQIAADRR
jgi:hypothetical protein